MSADIIDSFDMKAQRPLDSRSVQATVVSRNAIPSYQRYEGLIVYVRETQHNYQLRGGILDINWVEIG